MPKKGLASTKHQALKENGTLHTRPEAVQDPLFLSDEFFDPHDLVQIKYEMVRQVLVEGESIQQTADRFGFSRPSFYKAQADFQNQGLVGLAPQRRGPKGAHKLTGEVLHFIQNEMESDESLRTPDLVQRVEKQWGLRVHPRSIERALARWKKKR